MSKEKLHELLGYAIFIYIIVWILGGLASGYYTIDEYNFFWRFIHLFLFMECMQLPQHEQMFTGWTYVCVDNNLHIQVIVLVLLFATRYLISEEEFKKKNSIVPKVIKKGIGDITEGARSVIGKNKSKRKIDSDEEKH